MSFKSFNRFASKSKACLLIYGMHNAWNVIKCHWWVFVYSKFYLFCPGHSQDNKVKVGADGGAEGGGGADTHQCSGSAVGSSLLKKLWNTGHFFLNSLPCIDFLSVRNPDNIWFFKHFWLSLEQTGGVHWRHKETTLLLFKPNGKSRRLTYTFGSWNAQNRPK